MKTLSFLLVLLFQIHGLAQILNEPGHEYAHTPLESQDRSFWLRQNQPLDANIDVKTATWKRAGTYGLVSVLQARIRSRVSCGLQAGYLLSAGGRVPRGYCRVQASHIGVGAGSFSLRWLDGWAIRGAFPQAIRWSSPMVVLLRPTPRLFNYQSIGGGLLRVRFKGFDAIGFGGVVLPSLARHPFSGDTLVTGLRFLIRPHRDWTIEVAVVDRGWHSPVFTGGIKTLWKRRLSLLAAFSHGSDGFGFALVGSGEKSWKFIRLEGFGLWVSNGFFTPVGRVFSPFSGGRGTKGTLKEAGIRFGALWRRFRWRLVLDGRQSGHTGHISVSLETGFKTRGIRIGVGVIRDWLLFADRRYYGMKTWGFEGLIKANYRGVYGYVEGDLRLLRTGPVSGKLVFASGWRWGRGRIEAGMAYTKGVYPGTDWSSSIGGWARVRVSLFRWLAVDLNSWAWKGRTNGNGVRPGWAVNMALYFL